MIGGGSTGLAAALELRARSARVTMLERDPAPAVASADEAFATWDRASGCGAGSAPVQSSSVPF